MTIKAIETRYKGYRFRSRLEARWAVFMDSLGVLYAYEVEGFEVDGMKYLPDFWLLGQGCFVEIKPAVYKDGMIEWPARVKEDALELEIHKLVVTLCGTPGRIDESNHLHRPYSGYVRGDCDYFWCECPECGSIGIQYDGRAGRNQHKPECPLNDPVLDKAYNLDSYRLRVAYEAARSARFEYGERDNYTEDF